MATPTSDKAEFEVILFETQDEWAKWLEENHANCDGVWLRLVKKASALQSVSYFEALDSALCYGWIDGQKKSYDADSWIQKFTPRRARSVWSKINVDKAQGLIANGLMQAAGLREIERAKADGRWEAAYEPASTAQVPADFAAALKANPTAKAFFESLKGTNRYAFLYRIQTAKKTETRARRIEQFVTMLEKGERIYP